MKKEKASLSRGAETERTLLELAQDFIESVKSDVTMDNVKNFLRQNQIDFNEEQRNNFLVLSLNLLRK